MQSNTEESAQSLVASSASLSKQSSKLESSDDDDPLDEVDISVLEQGKRNLLRVGHGQELTFYPTKTFS